MIVAVSDGIRDHHSPDGDGIIAEGECVPERSVGRLEAAKGICSGDMVECVSESGLGSVDHIEIEAERAVTIIDDVSLNAVHPEIAASEVVEFYTFDENFSADVGEVFGVVALRAGDEGVAAIGEVVECKSSDIGGACPGSDQSRSFRVLAYIFRVAVGPGDNDRVFDLDILFGVVGHIDLYPCD